MLYHIWFGTKERKWLLLGDIPQTIKEVMTDIARRNAIHLMECEPMVEHMHLLLECEPQELPKAMKLLKGASSRRLSQLFPTIKFDAHTDHFWQRRFGAKVVPLGAVERVRKYIRTQDERLEKYDID